jgi:regulator of protease activity HflC (stomatin/prohibitin superfamily)
MSVQLIFGGVGVLIAFVAALMWVLPIYSVWAAKKRGQAELANAHFGEQVAMAEAEARQAAAEANKEAELVEASAVAESIKMIGDSLESNPNYLKWQWIKTLGDTDNDLIYVPTEAGLPIMEAGRAPLQERL